MMEIVLHAERLPKPDAFLPVNVDATNRGTPVELEARPVRSQDLIHKLLVHAIYPPPTLSGIRISKYISLKCHTPRIP
jgi:hypothetical protein